jgi:hypothetical protein
MKNSQRRRGGDVYALVVPSGEDYYSVHTWNCKGEPTRKSGSILRRLLKMED